MQPGTNGLNRLTLSLPGTRAPLVTYWTQEGQLAASRQSGSITHVVRRDGAGRPVRSASGDFLTEWSYGSDGRIARIEHEQVDEFTSTEMFTHFTQSEISKFDEEGPVTLYEHRIAYSARYCKP